MSTGAYQLKETVQNIYCPSFVLNYRVSTLVLSEQSAAGKKWPTTGQRQTEDFSC